MCKTPRGEKSGIICSKCDVLSHVDCCVVCGMSEVQPKHSMLLCMLKVGSDKAKGRTD